MRPSHTLLSDLQRMRVSASDFAFENATESSTQVLSLLRLIMKSLRNFSPWVLISQE